MVFVDGENFLFGIRKLFAAEFDRRHYLPREAAWGWFFGRIAEQLQATEFSVRWYVINELDFHPYADWDRDSTRELRRKIEGLEGVEGELAGARSNREKSDIVERYRETFRETEELMRERLAGWRAIQDAISEEHPFIRFYRPGWQPCFLPARRLGREKGIDIGLAVDLIRKRDDYDLALLFSGDGDYVPAVRVIQGWGKRVGLMEFESRDGRVGRGTSRRLLEQADVVIEVPFTDLKRFMGMEGDLRAGGNADSGDSSAE